MGRKVSRSHSQADRADQRPRSRPVQGAYGAQPRCVVSGVQREAGPEAISAARQAREGLGLNSDQLATDEHAADLVGAGADVEQLGVSVVALDGPVLGVA